VQALNCKIILSSPKATGSLKITMGIPKVFRMPARLLSASGDSLGMPWTFGS
jgi:hypothetical protein